MSDGIQEMLDNAREIRATNQVERHLGELEGKIDAAERSMAASELRVGLVVNAASVIMRLGVATTVVIGVSLLLAGQVDFMVFFMYLLTVSRIYAPFDQALALIAELFLSELSAGRLQAIYDEPVATGTDSFDPVGHDIVFDNVSFSYKDEPVLENVSFTAKEGEVTALVGPSGSGK